MVQFFSKFSGVKHEKRRATCYFLTGNMLAPDDREIFKCKFVCKKLLPVLKYEYASYDPIPTSRDFSLFYIVFLHYNDDFHVEGITGLCNILVVMRRLDNYDVTMSSSSPE